MSFIMCPSSDVNGAGDPKEILPRRLYEFKLYERLRNEPRPGDSIVQLPLIPVVGIHLGVLTVRS